MEKIPKACDCNECHDSLLIKLQLCMKKEIHYLLQGNIKNLYEWNLFKFNSKIIDIHINMTISFI